MGTIASLLPANFNFGGLQVGQQSKPMTATLTNRSNTAVLNVSKTSITGTAKTDFYIVSNTCVGMTSPLNTCSVSAVFKPTLWGKRSATLNVLHDGGGSPSMVSMVGSGQ